MTRRVLPRDEYARLVGTYLEPLIEWFPADADVIVVEDDAGAIIGCSSLFTRCHVEGTWIAEAHRGRTGVARSLLEGIRATAQRRHADRVLTASMDDAMTRLLGKLGATALPGIHFVWPMERES
ncbi:MAG: GNAT family N-acetyltransferase [Pseudomonadota bacterium]